MEELVTKIEEEKGLDAYQGALLMKISGDAAVPVLSWLIGSAPSKMPTVSMPLIAASYVKVVPMMS